MDKDEIIIGGVIDIVNEYYKYLFLKFNGFFLIFFFYVDGLSCGLMVFRMFV